MQRWGVEGMVQVQGAAVNETLLNSRNWKVLGDTGVTRGQEFGSRIRPGITSRPPLLLAVSLGWLNLFVLGGWWKCALTWLGLSYTSCTFVETHPAVHLKRTFYCR